MILAEELDADWSQVGFEHAPPSDALYGNPVFHQQMTGNSNSIRAFWTPLRKAGAATRAMLVQAAAAGWGVDPAACRTEASQVIHDASARRIAYGELTGRAAAQKPPADPPLKSPSAFRLIGKPLKRLDTPAKVDGSAQYGIDALPDGVKFATLAHCPVFRRQGRPRGRQPGQGRARLSARRWCWTTWWRWSAITPGRPSRGWRRSTFTWDEGPNAAVGHRSGDDPPEGRQHPLRGVVAKSVGDVDRRCRAMWWRRPTRFPSWPTPHGSR